MKTASIESEEALARVLGEMVAESAADSSLVLTVPSIMKKAVELSLLEVISGHAYSPGCSLGHRLKRFAGRPLVDAKGRGYVLGRERTYRWVYPVEFRTR
jgi:hypothetical protein